MVCICSFWDRELLIYKHVYLNGLRGLGLCNSELTPESRNSRPRQQIQEKHPEKQEHICFSSGHVPCDSTPILEKYISVTNDDTVWLHFQQNWKPNKQSYQWKEREGGGTWKRGGLTSLVVMEARFLTCPVLLTEGKMDMNKKGPYTVAHDFCALIRVHVYSMCVSVLSFGACEPALMSFSLTLTTQAVWNHNFDDYFCKLCGLSCLHPFPWGRLQRNQLQPGKMRFAPQHTTRHQWWWLSLFFSDCDDGDIGINRDDDCSVIIVVMVMVRWLVLGIVSIFSIPILLIYSDSYHLANLLIKKFIYILK